MKNTKERIENVGQLDMLSEKLKELLALQEKSIATMDRIINMLEN